MGKSCSPMESPTHEAGHRLFLKPAQLRPAVPGGFTLDDIIDTTAAIVTCPAGHTVPLSEPGGQHHQRKAPFMDLCTPRALRERCTKAKAGRILTIRPRHHLQTAARCQAAAADGPCQARDARGSGRPVCTVDGLSAFRYGKAPRRSREVDNVHYREVGLFLDYEFIIP
jgi:hypothetical protein